MSLLTEEQLAAVGRYQLGLEKVRDAIVRLNRLAVENGLDVRELPEFPLGMSLSDSQNLVRAHCLQVEAQRAEAIHRLDRYKAAA